MSSAPGLCDQVQRQVSPWIDRRLGPDARALVDEHLRACPSCRERFARTLQLSKLSRRLLANREPPRGLAARLKGRLVDRALEEARRPAWRRRLGDALESRLARPAAAVAAALLLFSAGFALGRRAAAEEPEAGPPSRPAPAVEPLAAPGGRPDASPPAPPAERVEPEAGGLDAGLPPLALAPGAERMIRRLGLIEEVLRSWTRGGTALLPEEGGGRPTFDLSEDPAETVALVGRRATPLELLDDDALERVAASEDFRLVLSGEVPGGVGRLRMEIRRSSGSISISLVRAILTSRDR